MNEHDRALMEGHEIAASNEYFSARPQIDTNDRRKVFEAGFKAAWKVGKVDPRNIPGPDGYTPAETRTKT